MRYEQHIHQENSEGHLDLSLQIDEKGNLWIEQEAVADYWWEQYHPYKVII